MKEKVEKIIIQFDVVALAAVLHVPEELVPRLFADGRIAFGFAELWIVKQFRARLRKGKNDPSAVRMLTDEGVKFQDSKHLGIGREPATRAELKASIIDLDRRYVCDVRWFPKVTLYKLPLETLVQAIDDGRLTTKGLSPVQFIELFDSPQSGLFP
jgi:hypothetical protein